MESEAKIAPTGVLFENENVDSKEAMKVENKEKDKEEKFVREILWVNVAHFTILHLLAFYGLYLVLHLLNLLPHFLLTSCLYLEHLELVLVYIDYGHTKHTKQDFHFVLFS